MPARSAFCLGILFCVVSTLHGEEPSKGGKVTPSELALEINALRTLYYLKTTPEQAESLLKLSKHTAAQAGKRKKSKLTADYRRLMEEVRDALVDDDEERVESLEDRLEEKTIRETPEIDDSVDVTDAARTHVPKVMKLFRPNQAAMFLGMYAEQIPDPRERLLDALSRVRGWDLADWQDKRDGLGDEIAQLTVGADKAKYVKTRDAVIDLLARARTMKDEDYPTKRGELEQAAEKILGRTGPTEVLRNFLENELARMLSNPRLEAALTARIK
jgi:hypothetical protein